jgi:hypothetical protein
MKYFNSLLCVKLHSINMVHYTQELLLLLLLLNCDTVLYVY